jgi:hypothetical protein
MNPPGDAGSEETRPRPDAARPVPRPLGGDEAPVVLEVSAWPDPALDRHGFDPGSRDFARFWTPLLGPAAAAVYRFLVESVRDTPRVDVDVTVAAEAIGLGRRKARLVVLPALDRLQRHELVQLELPYVAVRMTAPPLTPRLVNRLPASWRNELGI